MLDWNVVVTVRPGALQQADQILESLGKVEKTKFHDVLVMRVPSQRDFLGHLTHLLETDASTAGAIARVMPVEQFFDYRSAREFALKAEELIAPRLNFFAGKKFFVRMRRRGLRGAIATRKCEHLLNKQICEGAREARLAYRTPDVVVAIETIEHRAGIAVWTQDDLRTFPCLRLEHATRHASRYFVNSA
jgi:tRNA(Ser,Leu) C12 N-acetylase TAN1